MALTIPQEKLLLTYVSTAGENYEKYVAFAQKNLMPVFTKYYWPRWVQKRRRKVQALRAEITRAVAEEAMLGKSQRILLLENAVGNIQKLLEIEGPFGDGVDTGKNTLTAEQLVRLYDQQRKHMEAIARERNEWGATAQGEEDGWTNPKQLELFKDVAKQLKEANARKEEEKSANTVEAAEFTELP